MLRAMVLNRLFYGAAYSQNTSLTEDWLAVGTLGGRKVRGKKEKYKTMSTSEGSGFCVPKISWRHDYTGISQ